MEPEILKIDSRHYLLYNHFLVINLRESDKEECLAALREGRLYRTGRTDTVTLNQRLELTFQNRGDTLYFETGERSVKQVYPEKDRRKITDWLEPKLEALGYQRSSRVMSRNELFKNGIRNAKTIAILTLILSFMATYAAQYTARNALFGQIMGFLAFVGVQGMLAIGGALILIIMVLALRRARQGDEQVSYAWPAAESIATSPQPEPDVAN